jgi:hypothetical protein
MQNEFLVLRWSSRVFDPISISWLINHGRESLFSLLAGIETIPTMVHESIKPILEAFTVFVAHLLLFAILIKLVPIYPNRLS